MEGEMLRCHDPRLTYLNDLGYNVVRLPRKGINPLGVLGRDGQSLHYLGTLDQIWQSKNPTPIAGSPNPVSALNGAATGNLDLSIGLDILANALSGMFGSTAPNLKFAYKSAKSVQFKFTDVEASSIDPFLIDNFLAAGRLGEGPFVSRFLRDPDTKAFVITETLQAKSLSVTAKADSSSEVSVDVPAIQSVLGTKVAVSQTESNSAEVSYNGPDYLTFGFKVFAIKMENQVWRIRGVAARQSLAFGPPDADEIAANPGPFLLGRSTLLDWGADEQLGEFRNYTSSPGQR
jgi:hypothetical protein